MLRIKNAPIVHSRQLLCSGKEIIQYYHDDDDDDDNDYKSNNNSNDESQPRG
jgi:hypothetical protein